MNNHSFIQKTICICSFIILSCITNFLSAQSLTLTMPTSVCVNQTFTANVTSSFPMPLNYQWTASPGITIGPASLAAITFSTCGTKTITCTGYDSNNNAVSGATVTQFITVPCQPSVTTVASSTSVCNGYSTTISAIAPGVTGYTWLPGGSTQPTLSVAAGSYTVITSTQSNGCLATAVITIAVAPPLNLFVTSSSPNSCIIDNLTQSMKSVSLTVSGATSYSWRPYIPMQMTYPIGPETTVKPSASTCYTVTGITSVCSGTGAICVTITPQFSVDVVPSNTLICQGSTVSLGVTLVNGGPALPNYTYKWTEDINTPSSISNASGVTVNAFPLNNTTYTVEVLNTQNCVSLPKTVSVSVAPCTTIHDFLIKENTVSAYPNPASDKVFIFGEYLNTADVEILNAVGERLLSEKISFPDHLQTGFNVSHFPAGIYFIRVEADQNIGLIRFIKN